MLRDLIRNGAALFHAASPSVHYWIAVALLAGVTFIDYLTGPAVSFSVFYLLPISLVVWSQGLKPGGVAALAAAGCWLGADWLGRQPNQNPALPLWNATVRLTFFATVVVLLDRIRQLTRDLMDRVDEKTRQLTEEMEERQMIEQQLFEARNRAQREIAHELHDGLGQFLTGVAFKAKDLADQLSEQAPPLAPPAERLVTLVNDAIAETNRLARGLDPVETGTADLVAALDRLAGEMDCGDHMRCRFRTNDASIRIEADTALQLFRIAQEAANNASRHAHASELVIELLQQDGQIALAITDDGAGFTLRRDYPGLGMRTLQYRAARLGGSLTIDSVLGKGTTVRCLAPYVEPTDPYVKESACSSR